MWQNKKDKQKSASSSKSSDSDSSSSSDNKDARNKYENKKRKMTNSSKDKYEHVRELSEESEEEQSKRIKRDEHSKYKRYRNDEKSRHHSGEDYDRRNRHRNRNEELEKSRHGDMNKRNDRNEGKTRSENVAYKRYREKEEPNHHDRSRNYQSNSREKNRDFEERKLHSKDRYRHRNEFSDYSRGNKYNKNRRGRSRSNSFDHASAKWGKANEENATKSKGKEREKPNFGLSGKLAEETNTYRGVVIKYSEPPEARKPKRRWRLYPFKGEKALQTLYIHRESAYLIGRDRKVVDLPVDHPSCSKQHAVLQYRLVSFTRDDGSAGKRVRPYIIDLESANGTFINNKKIDPKKYVELLEKDVIKFGFSSREYVLLHENSKDEAQDDDVKQEEEENNIKEEPVH